MVTASVDKFFSHDSASANFLYALMKIGLVVAIL